MAMATHGRRWLSAGLAAALAALPAAPEVRAAAPAKAKAGDELNAKISALAQEAQTRFETADYAGAIELWTQAYAALPNEPAYDKRRNVLAYQIAQACVEAYELDPQLVYLRKAERLFDNYLKTISAKDKNTTAKVQSTLDELREKIRVAEEREAADKQAAAEAAEARGEGGPGPHVAAQKASEAREAEARAVAEREAKRARRLTIAGGALTGAGAIVLGVMAYGLARGARVDRDGEAAKADGVTDPAVYRDLLDQGTAANTLAIATAVAGGVLVVTGIGLLGAGAAGQQRARRDLGLAPTWLRGGAGVVLQGRF
ncbi:hypothetical protein SAMN02745121_05774 [Nannocystis exedens]|uniref:Uncharacterized protein n=1 Tax=Nannocystis exedens TaxID=54 RepID=A0A1I2DYW6_9BACT|nr:hypothetical protein [Nannocystis exedens]PCC69126.1 hypothetical protein NAEX_02148 [Nannocystis exedens]SFE85160.1 hypothetical protein SAMN02745121_05774 [Nannocystis exedens]